MKGTHKKSISDSQPEIIDDTEDSMKELKKSEFEPFLITNIEITSRTISNPVKIPCPLVNRHVSSWQHIIDQYFDSLSKYDIPKFSPDFYKRILSFSGLPNKLEISNYAKDKINNLTDKNVTDLLSQTSLPQFYEKIKKIQVILHNLNTIFNQLCGNVSKIMITNIKGHFSTESIRKFRDLIQGIVNEFFKDENSEVVTSIIHFFTLFDLLTKEIKDHFSSTVINTMNSINKKSKKSSLENTSHLFCKLCQIFPIGETSILERIAGPYFKNVIKMDLEGFLSAIMPNILDHFDDIYNFAYSINDVDRVIETFIEYYDGNQKRLSFDEVIGHFRLFKNFTWEIKMRIAKSIRNCLPRNDELIATKYAGLLDRSFKREGEDFSFDDSPGILDEMSLIQNREVFESCHFSMMLRRSLEVSMIPDENFVKNMRQFSGECSVTRFESLLNDFKESTKLVEEFKLTEKIPPFLNIFVFYSFNWSRDDRVLSSIPDFVKPFLNDFTLFYKSKFPEKFIEWFPLLSNCLLKINDISIKCNGITASILYSLLDGPKTSDQISKEIIFDVGDLEIILNTLKTKNYGNFILMKNDKYYINQNARPADNSIVLPLHKPKDEKTEKVMVMTSRGRQIEAVIILCLKGDTAIKKSDLFTRAQAKLKFILDNFLFEEKLKTLELKRFIKIDNDDNTVTYIP